MVAADTMEGSSDVLIFRGAASGYHTPSVLRISREIYSKKIFRGKLNVRNELGLFSMQKRNSRSLPNGSRSKPLHGLFLVDGHRHKTQRPRRGIA